MLNNVMNVVIMSETITKEMLKRWCAFYTDKYGKTNDPFESGWFTAALSLSIDADNGWLDDDASYRYRRGLCGGIECHECYGQGCEHSR